MKKIYVTRKIPDIGISMLKDKGYEVDINPHDRPLTKPELIEVVSQKSYDAVLSLLTDQIDGEVFDAVPSAKIFANYAVGFNNFNMAKFVVNYKFNIEIIICYLIISECI